MLKSRWVFVSIAIACSLTLHVLLFGGVIWVAPFFQKAKPEAIEVELYPEGQILEALTPKKQSIVRNVLLPEKIKAPDDETLARYLSENKQRVKEETKAANSGMTANRSNTGASTQDNPLPTKSGKKGADILQAEGYTAVDISKELHEMNRQDSGMSTVGESLPKDMKVGSFTALNTDRYMFYTFYARIEELIRYRWESRVQGIIDSFDGATLKQAGNRDWVTQVEFLLNAKGFLQKALLLKASGIPAFDVAVVAAFQEAKVFPNPPTEMVQEDGFIHVKYSFNVNYNPMIVVNRR